MAWSFLSISDMGAKVDAQIRGLGVGFLPTTLAQPYIDVGKLVVKQVERADHALHFFYAWRDSGKVMQGRALEWWHEQMQSSVSRAALLDSSRRPI